MSSINTGESRAMVARPDGIMSYASRSAGGEGAKWMWAIVNYLYEAVTMTCLSHRVHVCVLRRDRSL